MLTKAIITKECGENKIGSKTLKTSMAALQISGEMVVYTKPIAQLLAKIKIKSHLIQYPQINLRWIKNFLLN